MDKKAVRVPDDGELVGIAAAVGESAASKLKAATLLLGARQWAEAFYNAALGFEELGKAHLCMTMAVIPMQYRSAFSAREFSEMFNGHAAKAAFGHLVLQMVDKNAPEAVTDMLAEVEAAATQTNTTKFRGLYVDLGADGALLRPSDVGEADARWMVDRLQTLYGWVGPMYIELGQDPDSLAFLQQFRKGIDVAAVGAAVGTDMDLLLRQMRNAFQNPETAPPPWIAAALPPLP